MKQKYNVILCKSKKFAIRIVNLYKHLVVNKKEKILSAQVLRSGISIGAKLVEAGWAFRDQDFIAKMDIVLKEASETIYWLDLLKDTKYITDKEYDSLFTDCDEIIAIIVETINETTTKMIYEQK